MIAVDCLNSMITLVYVSFRETKSEKKNKVENGIREKLRALLLQGSYVVDVFRFDGGKLPAAIPVVQYSCDPIALDLF